MFEAIRYNLANLTRFSGRDSRSTFWFYILFLVIVQVVVSMGLSMVAGGMMAVDAFHAASKGTDQVAIQHAMFGRMAGMMRVSMWGSAVLSLVMTLLVSASFTRRLHDSGKPGWITAIVVLLQSATAILTIGMIGEMVSYMSHLTPEDPVAMQASIKAHQAKFAAQGALGWLPLLIVVVFGVWPSSDGDNRYGPEPDHL
ncbi:DUF805 domain-containing protein [Novosphingobium sp. 9]|uniref:DUF805 domain-containing protein n=1 Tax=Novosphingobium sp. 9 TaxID=2025349 RepID=UPI0021B648AC|nr:DUF805 domain-containing protein [Novosphingobium sp. 9]